MSTVRLLACLLLTVCLIEESISIPQEEHERTCAKREILEEVLKLTTTKLVTKKDQFFVITTIFNPASFKRRYELYHKFVQHMTECGAQLITIECIFPSLNQTKFQVTIANNPFHIQIKAESIYWLKETLINIAVLRLPSHAKWISWLDSDIFFHQMNWIEMTIKSLEKYMIVQMFKKVHFLNTDGKNTLSTKSFGYAVVHKRIESRKWYTPGYGWAMSIDTFHKINGLPDFCILGGGDGQFAYSLINNVPVPSIYQVYMNSNYKLEARMSFIKTFTKLIRMSLMETKKIVGYVSLKISHSWHGSRKDRQYQERFLILESHNFNYETDLTRNSLGLFVLLDKKVKSEFCSLQEDILCYFSKRNEDDTLITFNSFCNCTEVYSEQ